MKESSETSTEMSGYKLVYFPIRGRGERTRLAFAAAKIDFEDTRLPFEEWAKEKACKWISTKITPFFPITYGVIVF